MPAFSAEHVGTDGRARITVRTIQVVDRDGTRHTVGAAQLLAPLHSGPASLTVDRLLKSSGDGGSEPTHETVQWLKAQTERLGLTPDPVGLRVVWQQVVLDMHTVEWTPTGETTVRELHW
jgi:hypothetical protein